MIHRLITSLLLALFLPTLLIAQNKEGKPSKMNQARWEKEMKQYKNDFIVKSLDVTDAQKAKFLPLYNKMDDEIRCLNQQTMQMARNIRTKGEAATDLEKEKAAEAQFELRGKENQIELKYFPKLKAVLSPAQLLKLKESERKFMRHVMNQHSKSKKKK